MPLTPRACSAYNFDSVKKFISDFELDDRNITSGEFLIIAPYDELFAFGRLRRYSGFSEMCTVGVHPEHRGNGYGKIIAQALCELSALPVYVVTVIPEFFSALGFESCAEYPEQIAEKLDYCMNALPVPEPYHVMRKN
jgi:N-acetylglutamate synthase-like GNAT family acetyltransferase